jgi:hypothetical protein
MILKINNNFNAMNMFLLTIADLQTARHPGGVFCIALSQQRFDGRGRPVLLLVAGEPKQQGIFYFMRFLLLRESPQEH